MLSHGKRWTSNPAGGEAIWGPGPLVSWRSGLTTPSAASRPGAPGLSGTAGRVVTVHCGASYRHLLGATLLLCSSLVSRLLFWPRPREIGWSCLPQDAYSFSFFFVASEAVGLLNGVGNEDVLLSCWRGDCFRACFTVGDRLTSARGELGLSLIFFLLSVGDRDLE